MMAVAAVLDSLLLITAAYYMREYVRSFAEQLIGHASPRAFAEAFSESLKDICDHRDDPHPMTLSFKRNGVLNAVRSAHPNSILRHVALMYLTDSVHFATFIRTGLQLAEYPLKRHRMKGLVIIGAIADVGMFSLFGLLLALDGLQSIWVIAPIVVGALAVSWLMVQRYLAVRRFYKEIRTLDPVIDHIVEATDTYPLSREECRDILYTAQNLAPDTLS